MRAKTREKTVANLEAARKLISNPNNWTTGYWAVDEEGDACDIDSPDACKFCAEGSVIKSADLDINNSDYRKRPEIVYMEQAAERIGGELKEEDINTYENPVALVNDKLGYEAALRTLDLAIDNARNGLLV